MLKTRHQTKQEKQWSKVVSMYNSLTSTGAKKTAIEEAVMKRFKIGSRATVWKIVNRVGV